MRARFYANQRVPLPPRGWILEADVVSRQLHNTAVWGPLTQGEAKKLRGDYSALLRPLMPGDLRPTEASISHRALAAWTNRLHLPVVLAFAHLAHLCRICRDKDDQLITALQWELSVAPASRSWLEHSLLCVETIRCYATPAQRQDWPTANVRELIDAISADPIARFKRLVSTRRVARAAENAYAAVWSLYDALEDGLR